MMKRWLVGLLLAGLVAGLAQGAVTIMVLWSGDELAAFQKVVDAFQARTGIAVRVESVGRDLPTILATRVAAGNPPDLAGMPNPGQMAEFVARGALIPVDGLVDLTQFPTAFVDLATVGGKVYGIFISADLKSLVWYNPDALYAEGLAPATSWNELVYITRELANRGKTPWAVGFESGAASGWPGTDWIEDIMLRTAGPELYDKWVAHEIPWTHPAVKRAFELFGSIVRNNAYVYGGTTGVLSINFGDSPAVLWDPVPGAYLHRQATFIKSFIAGAHPQLDLDQDVGFFVFPPIDPQWGTPLLGAGDLISAFRDTPEVRAFLQYLASPDAQAIWCGALGKLATNVNVDPGIYPDRLTAQAAEILKGAEIFRFDASDLMPAAVGSGAFWKGVLDYVSGVPLDRVLQDIEAAARAAY
ncbi:MAG: Alpha-glucosides-binding periplasmic protein AglE precursor [Candidatus Bipolaricaulis sibiricus]|uniref:Alpha-glucosides-binding periplasmic protein AglE n=1 Tax=Bipolaricaulis sibiricus TaxID=2501609 RepID=A0A410FSC8_BIPS1|nr:MAG: Alpha-glucosides-binding periplasmic protein AglE precursor [Candidatus Bipolaricaulis sibiricus]